jgi:exodeoxyribonuclease V alpha subunit
METVRGYVDRMTYHNPENGYTIAQVVQDGGGEEGCAVVGAMTGLTEGETVELEGNWVNHPRYGRQFKVSSYKQIYPATLEGIRRYLGSGLIKGIGPVIAERIVEQFGETTLVVIESTPNRLREVPGLGKKKVESIISAWIEQSRVKDAMIFLQSHGVGPGFAVRIVKKYEGDTIAAVRKNPYRLERDIRGIGFQTADKIASELGFAPEAPERIEAGLRYVLNQAADDGHVFVPEVELLERGRSVLEVNEDLLPPALDALQAGDTVVKEGARFYLTPLYRAEAGVARSLKRLLSTRIEPPSAATENRQGGGITLNLDQKAAIELSLSEPVVVVTGGPGTGKTTVTRTIVERFEQAHRKVLLCSPTGRAAKRLAETTGREARTIHRLLEFEPATGQFRRNDKRRLEAGVIILDEASMIDVRLMNSLLMAVPTNASLVLVGDADQLPSVGPGNVLADVLSSGVIPVSRLEEIYRQEGESQIVASAHRIIHGEWPEDTNAPDSDFFFSCEEDPQKTADLIEDLCGRRLVERFGLDPIRDIQILTPMYRGDTGAINLNRQLQQRLNPHGQGHRHGEVELRVGDKVMQVRNNYEKDVFNGDLGRVSAIDSDAAELSVSFDSGSRIYSFSELDDLTLAYAISIHRSQGSEFPAVVLALSTQHYVLLQRNLLYTAVTRARRLMVIVGSRRALARAIQNNEVAQRFTSLSDRLAGTLSLTVDAGG